MAGSGLLNRIDAQGANGIDADLVDRTAWRHHVAPLKLVPTRRANLRCVRYPDPRAAILAAACCSQKLRLYPVATASAANLQHNLAFRLKFGGGRRNRPGVKVPSSAQPRCFRRLSGAVI